MWFKLICHVYKTSTLHFRRVWKYLYLKEQNIQRTNTAISKENAQHSQFCYLKVSIENYICKTNLDLFSFLVGFIEMIIITLRFDSIIVLVWGVVKLKSKKRLFSTLVLFHFWVRDMFSSLVRNKFPRVMCLRGTWNKRSNFTCCCRFLCGNHTHNWRRMQRENDLCGHGKALGKKYNLNTAGNKTPT